MVVSIFFISLEALMNVLLIGIRDIVSLGHWEADSLQFPELAHKTSSSR
jgi:hypothetical protein